MLGEADYPGNELIIHGRGECPNPLRGQVPSATNSLLGKCREVTVHSSTTKESRNNAKARTTKQARRGIQMVVPNRGRRQEATSDHRPCQQRSTPHVFNDEQWSFTGLHMVISDITDDASRSTELGTLRLSTTFGNMVGSAVGGILTEKYGTTMTFLCTAMLSAVSALLVWIYIPVQTKQHGDNNLPTTILPELCEGSGEDQQEDCRFPESSTLQSTLPQERKIVNFQKITRLLKIPAVAHLLGIKFALILANKIVLNAFPIILRDTYGMGPQEAGMFTMYCSIASAVLQMGLIRPLTRRYKDFPLMMLSSLVLTTSYVIATCMTERWHIYVFAVFKSFGVIMTNTVVVSALSKASPPEDTGAVMGLLAMFVSLGKVVSPPISTYVLDHVGYQFLGVTSAAMTTVVAGFIRLTKEEFR
ncbi:PREDICTED: uncharacterized protein LOC109464171 isoform X3 [Branchiostoma belcheri]|uniref:Uncharacterized protein LOC109464171 isoform X3 n=1 Tax=Branchiostoma belcheri TaxID=7741 RepID=A0A6P4YD45_BRABE|nr:PREDICTED: uncharacterized protein LOC109464171 isoform X3 [Branchiostoma belcheri]